MSAREEAVKLHKRIRQLYVERDKKIAEAVSLGVPAKDLASDLEVSRQHIYVIAAKQGVRVSKRVSLKDVAREAGVSSTTVSRVLRNEAYISQKTRNMVNAAARRTGYTA